MRTESQTRWEKGVDPHQAQNGIRYAAQLLVELAGGSWVGTGDDGGDLPELVAVILLFRPVAHGTGDGTSTDGPSQVARLERLGFRVDIEPVEDDGEDFRA